MKLLNFVEIAQLLKTNREKKGWSQADLSGLVGMKKGQGQLISNIERGLCNLPPKHGLKVCEVLSIDPDVMIETMANDYKRALLEEFKNSALKEVAHESTAE